MFASLPLLLFFLSLPFPSPNFSFSSFLFFFLTFYEEYRSMLWVTCQHRNFYLGAQYHYGLPRWLSGKESTCQCRRHQRGEFDPWMGKIPGGENGNPLQYSCLENSVARGAWWATIHGLAESRYGWAHMRNVTGFCVLLLFFFFLPSFFSFLPSFLLFNV